MKQPGHHLQWNKRLNEPEVDQGIVNGWHLSWNPDDGRFYVGDEDGVGVATFKQWNNAVYYARTHKRKCKNTKNQGRDNDDPPMKLNIHPWRKGKFR